MTSRLSDADRERLARSDYQARYPGRQWGEALPTRKAEQRGKVDLIAEFLDVRFPRSNPE